MVAVGKYSYHTTTAIIGFVFALVVFQSWIKCTQPLGVITVTQTRNSGNLVQRNQDGRIGTSRTTTIGGGSTLSRSTRQSTGAATALYGIRGFRETFASVFPSAVREISQRQKPCDHLLIDVNQFLHTTLRKASSRGRRGNRRGRRNRPRQKGQYDEESNEKDDAENEEKENEEERWDRALLFLMRDLDNLVEFASPRKSLVLAMDGPPPVAKLATQRKRRQTTLDRTDAQMKLLQRLTKSKDRSKNAKRIQQVWKRKKKHWNMALATLAITPGTDFMERAAAAILYWVWQRLQRRHSPLHRLQVFISSSQVHGEGELKLMEWLYRPENHIKPSDYVVLMGGDSDLVLQGLMIPPSLTRNINVLMPNHGTFIAFWIFEIVNRLDREYGLRITEHNLMMKIRTDIVLLCILNGNDYLPKLRGSSSFKSLFEIYTKLCHKWHRQGQAHQAYLVDPDVLEFNRPFALEFFETLVKSHKRAVSPIIDGCGGKYHKHSSEIGALGRLNNLKGMGIIPPKTRFEVIVLQDDDECQDWLSTAVVGETGTVPASSNATTTGFVGSDFCNRNSTRSSWSDERSDNAQFDCATIRLHVGEPGMDEYSTYELNHTLTPPRSESLRRVQHELAAMAVRDFLCVDEDDTEGADIGLGDNTDDEDDSDYPFEHEVGGYSDWDPVGGCRDKEPVAADVEKYAYGLLWNVQIYRDGTVSDFGYNYGKRLGPTAEDMYTLLKTTPTPTMELCERTNAEPISAGLSCIAALPLEVKELIPKPYGLLSDQAIEHMYSSCVDERDSSFDIKRFSELSKYYIPWKEMREVKDTECVKLSDHGWTVLSKEAIPSPKLFKPPRPFTSWVDRLSRDLFIHADELTCLEHNDQSNRLRNDYSRNGDGTLAAAQLDVEDDIGSCDDEGSDQDLELDGMSEMMETKTNALSTSDGVTALRFLNKLVALGLTVYWQRTVDHESTETLSLTVQPSHGTHLLERDIVVNRSRSFPYTKSDKQLKQEMAVLVLNTMFSRDFSDCSSRELKALYRGFNGHEPVRGEKRELSTSDGVSALQLLNILVDLGLEVKWESRFDNAATQTVSLTVPQSHELNQDVVVTRSRPFPYVMSEKQLRQQMAAFVLDKMFLCGFSNSTSRNLKAQYLGNRNINRNINRSINVTADGIDAISCLKQLDDAGLIGSVKWSALNGIGCLDLFLEHESGTTRYLSYKQENGPQQSYAPSRREIKHRLASNAMLDIFGPDVFNKTFESLKSILYYQRIRNLTGYHIR